MRIRFEHYEKTKQKTISKWSEVSAKELVQQIQTAFDLWRSGGKTDSIRLLELAWTLGPIDLHDDRMQFYCGVAWELAERSAQFKARRPPRLG